jgi:four helix bundle protein
MGRALQGRRQQHESMETDPIRHHRDLILWQKAMQLAVSVHHATRGFPRSEIFGLTSQLRRAAVSIPSNIAEGSARRTTREFLSFLYIARGSHAELETQLQLARDFGYLCESDFADLRPLVDEVGRILTAFSCALKKRLPG